MARCEPHGANLGKMAKKMDTIPYQDDVTEFCDFFPKKQFQDMAATKNLPKTYHTTCEPNGSHPISSLLMVAERRGSYQKFQNFITQARQALNFTFDFIKNTPT